MDDVGEGGVIVIEEQPHQRIRQQPEQDGEPQHHRRPEADPHAPGVTGAEQIVGAVVEPHPHGHRVRQSRWNHECRRDNLQGDLVGRQFSAAEHAHAQRREGEQPDFDGVGAANGQAQAPEFTQGRPRRAAQALADRVGGVGRVPADVQRHGYRHAVGDDGGDQAYAYQAQFWQAEHALDQCIVEQEVGHGTDQADDHYRRRAADGAGKAAQGHEAQVAGQGQRQQEQELGGRCDVFRALTEQQQHRLQVPQRQRRHQRHRPGQPQPGLGQAGGAGNITGPLANGHQGPHGRDHSQAENRHERIAGCAQATTGQRLGADAGHHQGVGQHHQHVGQLRGDQWTGQAQQCLEFMSGCSLHWIVLSDAV
ncbi:hypothetical protein D3C77_344290 [compost metagenome]